MVLEDRTIVCKDCAEAFVFSAGEQGFFLEKGLLNEPQRCPQCREARRRDRALYHKSSTVICAGCAVETTVPFVPRMNRPVYCSDCFKTARDITPAPPVTVAAAHGSGAREEELATAS
jgi:CxxC-x17-CxxC domain-containing protein